MLNITPSSKLSHICAKDLAAHVVMHTPVGPKGILVSANLIQTGDYYCIEIKTGHPNCDAMMEFRRETKSFAEKAYSELKSRLASVGVTCRA